MIFAYKPSILEYTHLWKPPYIHRWLWKWSYQPGHGTHLFDVRKAFQTYDIDNSGLMDLDVAGLQDAGVKLGSIGSPRVLDTEYLGCLTVPVFMTMENLHQLFFLKPMAHTLIISIITFQPHFLRTFPVGSYLSRSTYHIHHLASQVKVD